MTSEELVLWFKDHEAIKPHVIERVCKLPSGTIRQAISGFRDIPERHIPTIINELARYGLKH